MEHLNIHYHLEIIGGPIWAFAIHEGHEIASSLKNAYALNEAERLREEDPYTGLFTQIGVNRFQVETSRFQVDLNRAPEASIYIRPEQAWGLHVFAERPNQDILDAIGKSYQSAYETIDFLLQQTIAQYGYFVILDMHSYNAKRSGPLADINTNTDPQLNLGTVNNHYSWRPFIRETMHFLQHQRYKGQLIDARENVKFGGGHLSKWICECYGDRGCVLSLEFRKDFMDEWTGQAYVPEILEWKACLESWIPFLRNTAQIYRPHASHADRI